eukprot:9474368-Lingulodinium_polyedra.AAC.1
MGPLQGRRTGSMCNAPGNASRVQPVWSSGRGALASPTGQVPTTSRSSRQSPSVVHRPTRFPPRAGS